MKIVIVGSGGRLGAALAREYSREYKVLGFNHSQLDLGAGKAAENSIETQLASLDFDWLINCAALTNVDYCETHEEEAMQVNAVAARRMASIADGKNARCIHISTDYVFDGEKTGPYLETDPAHPISIYGKSKKQGEIEMLDLSDNNLVVRVSWVFGPDRPSFVDQILKKAFETEQVDAIGDKISAPAYTFDIARHLKPLLAEVKAGGILHLCNAGECTWRQYGQFAIDCAVAAGVPMKARTVGSLKMSELKAFVAKRPVNTVLSTSKLAELTGAKPRDWREAVEEYVARYFAPSHLPA